MKFKQIAAIVLLSATTTFATMWGYQRYAKQDTYVYQNDNNDSGKVPANYADFKGMTNAPADFVPAANAAIPATVHIKTKATRTASNNLPRRSPFGDLFDMDLDDFFGDRLRSVPQMASGSGAIISEDGYIVTNNHVVDGADEINVTLYNKKTFKAKLLASDPSSDLAVIKIEAKGLPFLIYGNSDEVKVGQWVLAVGYPLTLETTVTAGIVSAKGRTLDINARQSRTPVESFIQTDAAVNPGNSGGPLINTDGKLIGINSAIASPTGAYAGYSFTIPVNIVKKIVADLMKHGTVQRAYLGIEYPRENLSDEVKEQNGIREGEGVYVLNARTEGAAAAAGIKKGDIITKINGVPVISGADMVGQIATYRPGDKVNISYKRDGKEYSAAVTLRNESGSTDIVRTSVLDKLGAELQTLSKEDAKELGVNGGVVIKAITGKGALSKVRVQEGYVIVKADGKEVKTVDDFRKIMESASGNVKVEGMYPGYEGIYPIVIPMNSAN
ncbi:PDZ domain-containing protein [Pseudoflavitalea sp. X16]|uniref:trypsin-like peptidase domain-containing protein n=1 Tax=Paraflavitalea devenefica TaxID=2716334 RepID=UPI0014244888|nr:trypsin-like peptidase domain-containing protein [Paraflavitalea devenefica]NII27747.1 PDZ domain-containing protein [Paraflavitalea devenefica]